MLRQRQTFRLEFLRSTGHGLSDVTEFDVLAIRHDVTFRPTTMAVICKSGEAKSLSPSREIFYVRGVLNYFDADEGAALFSLAWNLGCIVQVKNTVNVGC